MLTIEEFKSIVEKELNQSGYAKDCNPQGKTYYSWSASESQDSVVYSPGNPLLNGKDWMYDGNKDNDFIPSVGYGMTLSKAIATAKLPDWYTSPSEFNFFS